MNIKFKGTSAILQDTHNPHHDQKAIDGVRSFLKKLQPKLLLLPGDLNDFYPISKFDKNPNRANRLQTDIDSTADMLGGFRKIVPNARIILELGNHEDRLRRYLWSGAPALATLDCLTIEGLYKLKENDIECVDYEQGVVINGILMVTHGDLIRAHSGYTAKGMMDKHGGSGVHGHSHRLGSHYKRDRFGVWGWFENGCLCDLNPDYVTNPNWQQGFSVVEFSKERFWVQQCQILNRRFMYGDTTYGD